MSEFSITDHATAVFVHANTRELSTLFHSAIHDVFSNVGELI